MAEPLQHLLMLLQGGRRSEAARMGEEGRRCGAGKMKWRECRDIDQCRWQCPVCVSVVVEIPI